MSGASHLDPKKLRPFLRLGAYLSPEFLASAERWQFLVSVYGLERTRTSIRSEAGRLAFTAACHEGWKIAQREIAEYLIQALPQQDTLREELKEARRKRDKNAQKEILGKLHNCGAEILVARRTLDVIVWTIFAAEHSTLRRLRVKDGQHSLSIQSIHDGMGAADWLNQDPLVMAVCTDMLSLVHVGDLVVSDFRRNHRYFVELKSGEKNAQLAGLAEFAVRSQCLRFNAGVEASLNQTDVKHYQRAKRQAERAETILRTVKDQRGKDPSSGAAVTIHDVVNPTVYWSDQIQRCYETLSSEKAWAISVIDECVYLGVYSDQKMGFVGFNVWLDSMECKSKVFSLIDSYKIPSSRPLDAMDLSLDLRRKILRGDIVIVVCFDIHAFVSLANLISPGCMRILSRRESARAHSLNSQFELLSVEGLNVCSKTAMGEMYLGEGVRERIVFDQHRPMHLLVEWALRRFEPFFSYGDPELLGGPGG